MKRALRTKSVGTKVSEAELRVLESRAAAAGLTLSEWVRDVLLASSVEMGTMAAERAILAEMLQGVLGVSQGERARVIIEPDRAAAIDLAVSLTGKGDVVLVAGKGHETGQYVGATVLPFSDSEVAAAALARHAAGDGTGLS